MDSKFYQLIHIMRNSQSQIDTLSLESGSIDQAHQGGSLEDTTNRSFLQTFSNNSRVLRLLQWTGNYWPEDNMQSFKLLLFYRTYYVIVRCILLTAVILTLYEFATETHRGNIVGVTISFTFFLDIISVLPAQYLNQNRLQRIATKIDITAYDMCTAISEKFLLVCLLTILVSIVCGTEFHPNPIYVACLTIGEMCVVFYLTFNLWFLLVDLQVSANLIDQLQLKANKQQLCLKEFNYVRNNLNERVTSSRWVSDFILIPCVASVFTIVIMMFHILPQWSSVSYTVGWIFALIKEMIFISIAFYYVATVNAKADFLTEQLSSEIWDEYSEHGRNSSDHNKEVGLITTTATCLHESSPSSQDNIQVKRDRDIERLTMCVSSLTKPIGFTLLFKRLSWNNVLVSAAGICLSISIGIVRSMMMAT